MKSLHSRLFLNYTAFIFPIILIIMILLYIILGNSLQNNATNELQADCNNISTLLDTQIENMDQLSKRIVSSDSLHTLLTKDLYSHDVAEVYANRQQFSNVLFDIIKLYFNHMHLNILDVQGHLISVGNTSVFENINPDSFSEIPWFEETFSIYGKKNIIPPRIPELHSSVPMAISLCRAFALNNSQKESVVLELQLDYNYLEKRINNSIQNKQHLKEVYVYNNKGQLIYPYDASPSEELENSMKEVSGSIGGNPQSSIMKTNERQPTLYAYKKSPYTNWTVFVAASEAMLLAPFHQFLVILVIGAILLFAFTLFLNWQVANNLTIPLRNLEYAARTLTFENLDTTDFQLYESDISELNSLYLSFKQMQKNLQNSMHDTMTAYSIAADAKLQALQSQMNPHFLYNTLASINVLAEDGEDEQIIKMCNALSTQLRYISSNTSVNVALWQEIEHLQAYIYLIKVKYEERVQFRINIKDELLAMNIPRLSIQPLVENCIKYAINVDPPWIIQVEGFSKNGFWYIRVTDNGPGFSKEFLEDFQKNILSIDWTQPLPELSINGMGLLNLYLRIYIKHKENMIFELENLPGGGASVTIGGPLSQAIGEGKNEGS